MGLRSGVVLRETEPGHCGIYLLTTASGNGFVGRYLLTTASGGIRRQIPPPPWPLGLRGRCYEVTFDDVGFHQVYPSVKPFSPEWKPQ